MNDLEKSIIQFIVNSYPEEFQSICISDLTVSEREYTGSGVIVSFEHPSTDCIDSKSINFIGPLIEAPELDLGTETALYVENGCLDCLDILVRGGGHIQSVTSYQLLDEDVNFVY